MPYKIRAIGYGILSIFVILSRPIELLSTAREVRGIRPDLLSDPIELTLKLFLKK